MTLKFNLKNRPPTISGRNQVKWVNPEKAALWFEGFEKQLREIQKLFKERIGVDAFIPVKEILGEDSS